jgi:hypothetical protein
MGKRTWGGEDRERDLLHFVYEPLEESLMSGLDLLVIFVIEVC